MLRASNNLPFRAEGEVDFMGATIAQDLDCSGGVFINPKGLANNAEGATVGRGVFFRPGSENLAAGPPFRVEGGVRLLGAKLGGTLDCTAGVFLNKGGVAINAGEISARRITLSSETFPGGKRVPFHAEGEVGLNDAIITDDLYASGGEFINAGNIAVLATGITVGGDIRLDSGAKADGEVLLRGAKIGGNLDCAGGRFINQKGSAIDAVNATVGGAVLQLLRIQC
jgi:hypothetical protein